MKWIYLEDELFDEFFKTYLFVTFSDSGLAYIVHDPIFIENLQLEVVTSHLDWHLHNSIQSELTSERTPNLSVITTASPSSSLTPQTSQPQATPSTPPSITSRPIPVVGSTQSTVMANSYTPLHLIANLGDMPQYYQSKITQFDGTSTYTAQQHTKKMIDYFEIYEIDADDIRMRIFVQSLTGEVRTWFRDLRANNIDSLETLYTNS